MDLLTPALHGAAAPHRPAARRAEVALTIGAGGVLGSALLSHALACGGFSRVQALVAAPLTSSMRGLEAVPAAWLLGDPAADGIAGGDSSFGRAAVAVADTAFVVFERARHSNGRDDAFFQPEPAQLPEIAAALYRAGVKRLLVVVPHAPALLPQALRLGLASLDEGQVAALGFEHLVFLRASQTALAAGAGGSASAGSAAALSGPAWQRWGEGLAAWWLSQLKWMVPAGDQPVRAVKLAALAVELALRLPAAAPGTRVLAPEWLSQASQAGDGGGALLAAWLAGADLPQMAPAPARRW
jgi:hypothetical protein